MSDTPELDLSELPAGDKRMLDSIADEGQRHVVACSLVAHRRKDRLAAGDPVPDLELSRLDGGASVRLTDWVGDRPLVLVFGSFT